MIAKNILLGATRFTAKSFKSCSQFCFELPADYEFLSSKGFASFSDYWDLSHDFVDEVNYRRGGWSGVTKLCMKDGGSQRNYYVKRQVNQFRYSLGKPLGALTFEYEVAAIKRNIALNLPAIDIAAWGVKKAANSAMGLLVTRQLDWLTLDELIAKKPAWSSMEVLLQRLGQQLLGMHNHGIQHGALYPKHIFINQLNGDIKLIDFERARKKHSAGKAILSDLGQLLKHLQSVPSSAVDILLNPYQLEHGKQIAKLEGSLEKRRSR